MGYIGCPPHWNMSKETTMGKSISGSGRKRECIHEVLGEVRSSIMIKG